MPDSCSPSDPGPRPGRAVRLQVTHRRPRPDVVVVRPAGEMDAVGAPAVAGLVRDLVPSGGHLVLDMRRVTFLDAGGIHALLDGAGAARDAAARFLVVGLDPAFHRVLRICGVEGELTLTGVADGERAAGVPLPLDDGSPEEDRPEEDRPVAGA